MDKIVLIVSDEDDISTNDVINWLDFNECKFIRINETTDVYFEGYEIDSHGKVQWSIRVGKHTLNSDEILNYWYRRGYIVLQYDFIECENSQLQSNLNKYLNKEVTSIYKSLNAFLEKMPNKIGNVKDNYINKLEILNLASECDIDIPESIIATSKDQVLSFYEKHKFIITKAISEGISFQIGKEKIDGFTSEFTLEKINKLDDVFFPTLFQKGLNKKWELRIFFINNKFYSSAIFSQNDDKTKVDFRHYGSEYSNRTPPVLIPELVKNKLKKLMSLLKMQSGSIDMVYTSSKEYVFLEVNPVGQFAQVSDPCNYYLEEIIAKELQNG